jgi:hypothetical protein
VRTVFCRRRPSDPWFDQDCRAAKHRVRQLERVSRRAERVVTASSSADTATSAATAAAAWKSERRAYRELLCRKCQSFWQEKVEAERFVPRRLWQTVDQLMGRGHVPLSSHIRADTLHQHFDYKVAGVRSSTAGAPPPSFSTAPVGCVFPVLPCSVGRRRHRRRSPAAGHAVHVRCTANAPA